MGWNFTKYKSSTFIYPARFAMVHLLLLRCVIYRSALVINALVSFFLMKAKSALVFLFVFSVQKIPYCLLFSKHLEIL